MINTTIAATYILIFSVTHYNADLHDEGKQSIKDQSVYSSLKECSDEGIQEVGKIKSAGFKKGMYKITGFECIKR